MAAESVQLLCLDVDGVLTDGSIVLDDNGVESKRFHVRDGTGIRMWLNLGFQIALITGRSGQAVNHRAKELGISHVIQGSGDKLADLRQLLTTLNLDLAQTAMLGDDLPDLTVMRAVGYPMAVSDAVSDVRAVARLVTQQPGGHGAVREAIEHLLKAKECWHEAQQLFG